MQGCLELAEQESGRVWKMIREEIREKYERWCHRVFDSEVSADLSTMSEEQIEEAFSSDLTFGTAGLRGIMEAGTNRMNVYTVARASQGLADYLNRSVEPEKRKIAVSRDSRNRSELFSRTAAEVFAANGIQVLIYREIMPVPLLSYAVRQLDCAAGVMITASHNPPEYNGYKVYGADGCQITSEAAEAIQQAISETDLFEDVRKLPFEKALEQGMIQWIPEEIYDSFTDTVKNQSLIGEEVPRDCAIVYSPLNGTGLRPVLRALKESGYTQVTVVPEQEQPDGNFPTCRKPNPEEREALQLGLALADRNGADLVMATDPDCDRIGIAVRDAQGQFVLLSGNETGMLLLDYICSRRTECGTMPQDPVMIKTIVTTDIAERIAESYGVHTQNVLTGFKYIGEQMTAMEKAGHPESYLLGFEESYGYLTGTHVRDKDGVGTALMICDMFAYHRSRGISLLQRLEQIYEKHGYCLNSVYSYQFEGSKGSFTMERIMNVLRSGVRRIGGFNVEEVKDYREGIDGLPKSNVLRFRLASEIILIARPSGTEPKLKFYLSIYAKNRSQAKLKEKQVLTDIDGLTKI